MKNVTLKMHELKVFVRFMPDVPDYLNEQLGDMTKRAIRVKEADFKMIRSMAESGLQSTRCKARRRQLNNLLARLAEAE